MQENVTSFQVWSLSPRLWSCVWRGPLSMWMILATDLFSISLKAWAFGVWFSWISPSLWSSEFRNGDFFCPWQRGRGCALYPEESLCRPAGVEVASGLCPHFASASSLCFLCVCLRWVLSRLTASSKCALELRCQCLPELCMKYM